MEVLQSGATIIVDSLVRHGVDTVFAAAADEPPPLMRAIAGAPAMRVVRLQGEAAAVMAADAYARVSGRPGVVVVGRGSAALGAVSGMTEAWGSSSPVLLLTTHVESSALDAQRGALGETRDLAGAFASCTRTAELVDNPYAISHAVHTAWIDMYRGRPRPVMRAFPEDFLREAVTTDIVGGPVVADRPEATEVAVERTVDALRSARRPVIVAGGGVVQSHATEEILRLAEILHAPVLTSVGGKGAISDEHPLARGTLHSGELSRAAIASADVVLAVGLRFTALDTDGWAIALAADVTLVHIDIDNTVFDKNYEAQVPICADARTALEQILHALANTSMRGRRPSIGAIRRERRNTEATLRESGEGGIAHVEAIRRALHPGTIVACDRAVITDWMARRFPVIEPHTFLYPAGALTCGFALPAAVGAHIAEPARSVVAVTGAEGFLRALPELAAAAREQMSFPVVVYADGKAPVLDFAHLAKTFGADALTVDTARRLRSALQRAAASDRLTFIEVTTQLDPPPRLGTHAIEPPRE